MPAVGGFVHLYFAHVFLFIACSVPATERAWALKLRFCKKHFPKMMRRHVDLLLFLDQKTMTAREVTGLYAFFSSRKSGNFLYILGRFPYSTTQKNLEKKEKIHWRKFNKCSGGPKLQISVPCRGRTCPDYPVLPIRPN